MKSKGGDGVDGKWGDATNAAIELYLKNRDGINSSIINTFLDNEKDHFYQDITLGGGTEINLGNIDVAGPQLKTEKWKEIYNILPETREFISNGGDINSGPYNNHLKIKLNSIFDTWGESEVLSLIMDGLDNGFVSEGFIDMTGFMELIVTKVPQFASMAEMDAINLIKELGINTPLGDENGVMSVETTLKNLLIQYLIDDYLGVEALQELGAKKGGYTGKLDMSAPLGSNSGGNIR